MSAWFSFSPGFWRALIQLKLAYSEFCNSPTAVSQNQCASFNRDSQDIPESRRQPILPGMSGEERVSVARHAILFEWRLIDTVFGHN
jgi:hypothetical protein